MKLYKMKFINLRNYTENSILNAAIKVEDLVAESKERWYKAAVITDKFAYWMIKFYQSCLKEDIKPIFWQNIKTQWGIHNFLVFSKSEIWKENMFKIISEILTEQTDWIKHYKWEGLKDVIIVVDYNTFSKFPQYYLDNVEKENLFVELQPRNTSADFNLLKEQIWIDNIVVTSPTYYLKKEDEENIYLMKSIEKNTSLDNITDDFSWYHFKTEEEIRKDFNYISDEDFENIKSNINNIIDSVNFELDLETYQIPFFQIEWEDWEIYQKNQDYLKALKSDEFWLRFLTYKRLGFRYKQVHEEFDISLDDVLLLSHKEFDVKLEKKLREYSIPELKIMSKEHWSKKKMEWYNNKSDIVKEYIDKIEYELFIVHKMGFDSYLLMVWEYINWSRNNWDLVWPWRGSAAGSIVTFLTWITDIDPIKYELLFERFLNPSRVNLPDIDTDFSNRDNVIKHSIEKYWAEKVTPIITFWKLTSKTVLKWVWKAYWVNFNEINRLNKTITLKESTWHVPLETIKEENLEFSDFVDSSQDLQKVYNKAKNIEGFKQLTWTHACAVIIAPKAVTKYMPLQYPMDKSWKVDKTSWFVTQLEGPDAEAIWLLKMDFLWLNNLTIINDCLKIVKKHKNIEEDMTNVDVNRQDVYKNIFHTWRTTNVFQFESSWMKKYMKGLKPNNIEDLIAMVSLYRPWPLEFIPSFINRKHWIEKIEYLTEELREILLEKWYTNEEIDKQKELLEDKLKSILDVSYWIAVYQEQLMFMAQYMAGFTLWEADLLRRAIWKKKIKIIKEQRAIFIEKAEKLWFLPEVTWYIYDATILPAANYSFNKSHAACYAFIAYQWAYLKTYYPAEYTTAILMTQWDDLDRVAITIEDALIDNINVIPLDINESNVEYEYVDDKNIRMGLKVIKWVGEKWLVPIIEERTLNWKFKDFDDFLVRTKDFLNKWILEGLIWSWALDNLMEQNKLLHNIPKILAYKKKTKTLQTWQTNLFSMFDDVIEDKWESNLLELEEPVEKSTPLTRSQLEFNYQWFMVKNHPFDWIKSFIENYEKNRQTLKWNKNVAALKKTELEITWLAIIVDLVVRVTKKWDTMLSIKLLGTDYYISAMIGSSLTSEFYHQLVWKDKNKPSWIFKFIEYKWKFSVNEYGRSLFISELKIKDINKAYIIAKDKWLYREEEKCNWGEIYKYKNEVLEYQQSANIIVSDYLYQKENEKDYIDKLNWLKQFLLKHNKVGWKYHVIINSYAWDKYLDTKMYINDKDALINYIERISWLKVTWIKRTEIKKSK